MWIFGGAVFHISIFKVTIFVCGNLSLESDNSEIKACCILQIVTLEVLLHPSFLILSKSNYLYTERIL